MIGIYCDRRIYIYIYTYAGTYVMTDFIEYTI